MIMVCKVTQNHTHFIAIEASFTIVVNMQRFHHAVDEDSTYVC